VYGHGLPVSLVLDQHHFSFIEHGSQSGSQLVNLSIDGKDSGLAVVKTVQRNSLKKTLVHIDFQRISLQEQLHVTVSVVLEGEAIGVKEGGMLEMPMHALHLRCEAGEVPDTVTHDISAMKIGDTLEAGAFVLPAGCVLLDRPEECIALIRPPMRTATPAETPAPTPTE
jgi:large subunit ribosomal protein L25